MVTVTVTVKGNLLRLAVYLGMYDETLNGKIVTVTGNLLSLTQLGDSALN